MWGRWRYDLVALATLVVLVVPGLVEPERAFLGFGHPAVVTVTGLLPVQVALAGAALGMVVAGTVSLQAAYGSIEWPVIVLLGAMLPVGEALESTGGAATVLMAPIAVALAGGLGTALDPFLMAVAVGASSAFLTPIGHQSNTLVMGPGGYRFSVYLYMGVPLSLLVALLGVPLILLVWPL